MVRILDEIQQRLAGLRGSDREERPAGRLANGYKGAVGPKLGQHRHGRRMLRLAELVDGVYQLPKIPRPPDGDAAGLAHPRAFFPAELGPLRVRDPHASRKVRRKQVRLLERVD
jgi:hypothetical protein